MSKTYWNGDNNDDNDNCQPMPLEAVGRTSTAVAVIRVADRACEMLESLSRRTHASPYAARYTRRPQICSTSTG